MENEISNEYIKNAINEMEKFFGVKEPVLDENIFSSIIGGKVKDAIKLMVKKEVSGLPVVDKGKVVGMLTEADALAARTTQNVESAMTKRVYKVSPDASIKSVSDTLKKQKIKRVPVVDKTGKLVGVVSRRDVLAAKL